MSPDPDLDALIDRHGLTLELAGWWAWDARGRDWLRRWMAWVDSGAIGPEPPLDPPAPKPPKVERPSSTRAMIDALRAVPLAAGLAALGMSRTKRRDRMGPCPACGGEDVHVRTVAWVCYRCGAKHDLAGTLRLLAGGWDGARALAERAGLWSDQEPDGVPVVAWRDPEAERRAEVERRDWLDEMWEIGEELDRMWSWVQWP